MIRNFIVITD